MANQVILSERFSLKWRDGLKSFIIGVGTPILYYLQSIIPGWDIDPIAKIAIAGTVSYLLKNFFEAPKVITTYSTNNKAADVAETLK